MLGLNASSFLWIGYKLWTVADSDPANEGTLVGNGFHLLCARYWSIYSVERRKMVFVVYCIEQLEFYAKDSSKFSQEEGRRAFGSRGGAPL